MSDKPLTDESGRNSLDPKHAPVSIPPGSFDIGQLTKGLDAAVKAKPEARQAAINDALKEAAGEGTVLERVDPSLSPGYRVEEVEHPELHIIEHTQVFDQKLADEAAEAEASRENAAEAPAADAPTTARGSTRAAPKE